MYMNNLFSQYFKEREDIEALITDKGFVLYKFEGEGCVYISDIYVLPEFRKSKVASEMANKVCDLAKTNDCNQLIGSVDATTNNYVASMRVLKGYGMKEFKRIGNMIYFIKELI